MYYGDVASVLPQYPLSQHFDRSWTAHVSVKASLYEAESQMQAAAAQRAEDNVNVEITRLKVLSYNFPDLAMLLLLSQRLVAAEQVPCGFHEEA